MSTASRGLVAGLLAAGLLALLKLVLDAMGMLGELDTIRLLATASSELLGTAPAAAVGWVLFFVLGALWGLVFAWIYHRLPGAGSVARGMVFAAFVWGVMMVFFMPVAGAGWFGLGVGPAAPLIALVGHLIFGAAMGLCFARLSPRTAVRREERRPS